MNDVLTSEKLQRNICRIQDQISETCAKVDRLPQSVTLVAVTKTVTAATMKLLADLGIKNVGENRVQDAQSKYNELCNISDFSWHMIGHLQTNKVKVTLPIFDMIHSVDSMKLAKKISECSTETTKILLQVNTSKEESKHGFDCEQLCNEITEISTFDNIVICGLMTMAPFTADMDVCRKCFRETRILAEKLRDKGYIQQDKLELSMGMSGDFPVAIEEGATLVRVGSAIFK
ncbi:YggS family pyridoxal phosphate-dependent enzyme [Candidatus Uabimicrobium amorphum]|uniref:Pyridoxal phosphate homeostasis protein n=1 Tax=Uabimicrobium amorphum TaxID=2596890 RepID=A0A5S9F3R0_UABAM|nr:YggS family pyridoxal phosphate-dependent enzyme [Candidatus Uabimicrobium amorphum]BBM84758.1 YggS family pyridoxal phosphate enzyme [Candidatus Uabimicrobium amorphum]